MRQAVKGYSLWYLVEGVLLVVTGILAMILNAFLRPTGTNVFAGS